MIDIHPPHHAATTWRDFFIHIATIVLGLLIAIGLEQTVERVHRHTEAREARENIKQEIATNIEISQSDLRQFGLLQQELGHDLDLLNSGAADPQILGALNYQSAYARRHDAAWAAARINGSLALIPSGELTQASYFYGSSSDAAEPALTALFSHMDTAQALLDHARNAGKLTAFDRQQLLSLTTAGLGDSTFLSKLFSFQIEALKKDTLQ